MATSTYTILSSQQTIVVRAVDAEPNTCSESSRTLNYSFSVCPETQPTVTFALEDVAARVTHCMIDKGLDCDSDHLPIALVISWNWQPAEQKRKRLWSKTNQLVLRQVVQERLARTTEVTELRDRESIEKFVSALI